MDPRPPRNIPIHPLSGFTPFAVADIEQSIPQRFAQQVQQHGSRPAIQSADGALSFADLDRRANGIAHAILGRRHAGAEPIALLFERGASVVAAILGVLKAGKFYVLLDPSYPADRLRQVLDDSGAPLILADRAHVDQAQALARDAIGVVDVDAHGEQHSEADPGVSSAPADLALLIYTSGSTGRPKGVMHTHRNVLADTRHLTNEWGVSPRDRFLWHTSVSFGGSTRTLFSALLNGSALFPFDTRRLGFNHFPDWLLRNEISLFRTVPTTFRSFMTTLPAGLVFPSVRIVSMGGEPIFRSEVDAFNRHFPSTAVLVHPFGPTESMAVCWSVTAHGAPLAGNKVAIGYPLSGTTVLLLDDNRRPVDDGQIGEIAVRSRYLSPGYWRDPERTNSVFLMDPADGESRIYLTGDLGRRVEGGVLMHMGRRDFQVKIRGFRIELSEVEIALRAMSGVRDAVVVGVNSDDGQSRLVAYVVAAATPAVTTHDMRTHLAASLPDYMVPSAFVAIDELPLTTTGKIDRLRLPAMPRTRPEMTVPFARPESPLEARVADLWAQELDLDLVGIHDDFFALGGDSLIGMRLIASMKRLFAIDLEPSALFEHPTVAETARTIARRAGGTPPSANAS